MKPFTRNWWIKMQREAIKKQEEAHYDLTVSYGMSEVARQQLERYEEIAKWIAINKI